MFIFEMAALGNKFAVARLLIDIPGIIIIALILSRMASKKRLKNFMRKLKLLNRINKIIINEENIRICRLLKNLI